MYKRRPGNFIDYMILKGLITGEKFTVQPFHLGLAEKFEQVILGKLPDGKKNLIISMPPRYGKTYSVKGFMSYCLGNLPDSKFIVTGYSSDIAKDTTRDVLNIVRSEWFNKMFPRQNGIFNKDCESKSYKFETRQGGGVYGVGAGGALTGFAAGVKRSGFGGAIIIDDPLKANSAFSRTQVNTINRWYFNTLRSRVEKDDTPKILIMQRICKGDLVDYVKQNEPDDWYEYVIPGMDENGNSTWEKVISTKSLRNLKEVDPSTFYAQYMQKPQLENGNLIKKEWWKYFELSGYIPQGTIIITSDTAMYDKATSDDSCFQVWDLCYSGMYLLDLVHGKWDYPQLVQEAKNIWYKWTQSRVRRASAMVIEAKMSGISLVQTLQSIGINAEEWKPQDYQYPIDKVGRAKEMCWGLHAGRIFVPNGQKFTEELINQASEFTTNDTHEHDDMVDSADMAYSLFKYYGGMDEVK